MVCSFFNTFNLLYLAVCLFPYFLLWKFKLHVWFWLYFLRYKYFFILNLWCLMRHILVNKQAYDYIKLAPQSKIQLHNKYSWHKRWQQVGTAPHTFSEHSVAAFTATATINRPRGSREEQQMIEYKIDYVSTSHNRHQDTEMTTCCLHNHSSAWCSTKLTVTRQRRISDSD
jgi:hypothetical protein